MSSLGAGPFIISPKDAPGQSLVIGEVIGKFPPPDVPVRVEGGRPDRWLLDVPIDRVEHSPLTVALVGGVNPGYKWITKVIAPGAPIALFVSATSPPGDFRFERAGDEDGPLFTIGLPNEDSLLTLGNEGEEFRLTFQRANGTDAQRFRLLQIPRD